MAAPKFKVGDHYHMLMDDGRKFCAVVTSIDDQKQTDDWFVYSYTMQGYHPDNRDCEWAIEAENRMRELAWGWMDQ